ncbi:aminomethyl-transferring glycine dehydrogenase [Agaribacterium haliotis]|uniref:aminomethyl-transferring glycine dehydrogenase n=1 Tax=Agaribacterium haliotis TaxID=2013869 RepID=UPI000BB5653E|nr:aminomethyl-transferring glycine dehydrogenase [Agaribacterium haliotis]
MSKATSLQELSNQNEFIGRHIGPDAADTELMLKQLGLDSLEQLVEQAVPESIRLNEAMKLGGAVSESDALAELKEIASRNKVYKNYIGQGYHDCHTPLVIQRNVLENPGWYTAYTPYQPEISQGRLEALLNFQQMIIELTGMDMANASLLDEATGAAEAMAMAKRSNRVNKSTVFFVDEQSHPQTIEVVRTRAGFFGFELHIGPISDIAKTDCFAAYVQYPGTDGEVPELKSLADALHSKDAQLIVGADILSLVLLESPGAQGADIVVGSNQRFGIPMGFGGPHAGFFAFREAHKRTTPGRIIGVSIDSRGKQALRMAMQTREQHIRREKANSNICTSQVLLAIMSAFYAMYHGAEGVKRIANRVHFATKVLAAGLEKQGYKIRNSSYFDTLCVEVDDRQQALMQRAVDSGINLRAVGKNAVAVSLNECTSEDDIKDLLSIFAGSGFSDVFEKLEDLAASIEAIPPALLRKENALQHQVFELYHSETDMLRYMKRLESRDVALNLSMIPLGSCTMKLNATAEMVPVTWPEFGKMHPFAPLDQAQGYLELFEQLEAMLATCTGYDAISLQPNAGSQGEYAGLVAIANYFKANGESERDICIIPSSAHGTNPATAHMAGMKVVVSPCTIDGNVDIEDLKAKVEQYGKRIAAIMVTYPSTHGVFEEDIRDICALMHSIGAQVYVDGANLNAMVGLAALGEFGGDVSHLNLHKTFCIPHGGGGPGMGPIGVKNHLAPFLPSHPLQEVKGTKLENGVISAAPWGSASILPISWMYIRMMGKEGLTDATRYAILNANYVAEKLKEHFPILYTGKQGRIAHECLLDLRPLKASSGITEEDIAKRLMDFGFHAPTMSFPVAGTLMIEPTESESLAELDRFCDAMIKIREEIADVESGKLPQDNNPLVRAPHSLDDMLEEWDRPYSREEAARPLPYLHDHKYWPYVNRIDNVYGDRNLLCSCPSIDNYADEV